MKKAKGRSRVREFVRRSGAPFSPEDTDLVGRELLKIAEQSAVDEVASLDPREVFESVYADKKHPLRAVYGDFTDVDGAAREHWIYLTRQMINSLSVVYVDMPKSAKPIPLTVYSDAPTRAANGVIGAKRRVLSNDMLSHDPQFLASLRHKIEMVQKTVAGLGWIVRARTPPREIQRLHDELEAALARYSESIQRSDAAAE